MSNAGGEGDTAPLSLSLYNHDFLHALGRNGPRDRVRAMRRKGDQVNPLLNLPRFSHNITSITSRNWVIGLRFFFFTRARRYSKDHPRSSARDMHADIILDLGRTGQGVSRAPPLR